RSGPLPPPTSWPRNCRAARTRRSSGLPGHGLCLRGDSAGEGGRVEPLVLDVPPLPGPGGVQLAVAALDDGGVGELAHRVLGGGDGAPRPAVVGAARQGERRAAEACVVVEQIEVAG